MKQVGDTCWITYDSDREINDFDVLRVFNSERKPTGRMYWILEIKPVKSKHPFRKKLLCQVIDEIPVDDQGREAKVHPIYWYSRKRRPR